MSVEIRTKKELPPPCPSGFTQFFQDFITTQWAAAHKFNALKVAKDFAEIWNDPNPTEDIGVTAERKERYERSAEEERVRLSGEFGVDIPPNVHPPSDPTLVVTGDALTIITQKCEEIRACMESGSGGKGKKGGVAKPVASSSSAHHGAEDSEPAAGEIGA